MTRCTSALTVTGPGMQSTSDVDTVADTSRAVLDDDPRRRVQAEVPGLAHVPDDVQALEPSVPSVVASAERLPAVDHLEVVDEADLAGLQRDAGDGPVDRRHQRLERA